MPIRPEQRRLYPPNWKLVSEHIRFSRARGRCECAGECGEQHDAGRCREFHRTRATWAQDRRVVVILTVAHLDHNPANCRHENLKAMCQRCHLRYDAELHAQTRARRTPGTALGS